MITREQLENFNAGYAQAQRDLQKGFSDLYHYDDDYDTPQSYVDGYSAYLKERGFL